MNDNDVLVSFDVVSLYTNVPQPEAIARVLRRWPKIKQITRMSKMIFIKALKFCISENNIFMYEDTFYKQKHGLAMGCSLSGILAEFVLDDLLDTIIPTLPTRPTFLKKYVDDIIAAIPPEKIETTLEILNQNKQKIQFTVEKEENNKINFLDMTLIRKEINLEINWYSKDLASGRLLNYFSAHPGKMIYNTAVAFAHRVIKLSNTNFHKQNYAKIKETLLKNNFPIETITKIINKVRYHQPQLPSTKNADTFYRKIPYIPNLSERIAKTLHDTNSNLKIAYKPVQKLASFFSKMKTKIKNAPHTGVIYKLDCQNTNCDKTYIGETGRDVKTRIKEHQYDYKNALKNNETNFFKTACLKHAIEENHNFDFENYKIVDKENHWRKRKNIEALHIHLNQPQATNFKTDTQFINTQYKHIIDTYKKIKLATNNVF